MSKHNIITKILKKQFLSANNLIESYFNNLKNFIIGFKKSKFDPNNKALLIASLIFLMTCSYFIMPSFYNKQTVVEKIKNQILDRYGIEVSFNEEIRYGLFPKPHFVTNNLSIVQKGDKIAEVKKFRIYIAYNRFFSFNNIDIQDLIFLKSDFNINKNNISFFKKLFIHKPSDHRVLIKNSNIFFKNFDDEILFLIKIFNTKFFFDINNFENNLSSRNEIFNLPFTLKVKNNNINNQLSFEINSKKIRLFIENNLNYKNKIKNGKLDISLINKSTSFNYQITKSLLNFSSTSNKNFYNGQIDFLPFYFQSDFNFENLNTKNFFKKDSFIIELIRSQILNNSNLNMDINLNIKKLINIDQLNNLLIKVSISQGNIDLSDTTMMWNNDLKIVLKESLLSFDKDEIFIIGKVLIDINDIDNFYSGFQIKKINRKEIKDIEIDFNYNLTKKQIFFGNPKIDGKSNLNLEKFIEDFNEGNNKFFNKITFKNFVNNFFGSYKG